MTLILDFLNYEMYEIDFKCFFYCAQILIEYIYNVTEELDEFKRYNTEKLNNEIAIRLEPKVMIFTYTYNYILYLINRK